MTLPLPFGHWLPGWYLIGQYDSGVGSWLLHNNDKAMLLEVPEGLTVKDVQDAVARLGVRLYWITASHDHYDHLERNTLGELAAAYPATKIIHPAAVAMTGHGRDRWCRMGDEKVGLVPAPKHSLCDVVTVFRGVAMTGDIETGTLDSVTNEVPLWRRKLSMKRLQHFEKRTGYKVHTTISAHLNSVREGINWSELFKV